MSRLIEIYHKGSTSRFGDSDLPLTIGSTEGAHIFLPEAMAVDYGHADLLWANNAKSLVWEPISKWIKSH